MLQLTEAGPAIETNTKIAYRCLEKALLVQHADRLLRSDTNIQKSRRSEPCLQRPTMVSRKKPWPLRLPSYASLHRSQSLRDDEKEKKRKDGRLALMSFNSARLLITMRTSNRIERPVAADSFSNKRHYTRDISPKDAKVNGEEAARMEKEFGQMSVKKSADIPCEAR